MRELVREGVHCVCASGMCSVHMYTTRIFHLRFNKVLFIVHVGGHALYHRTQRLARKVDTDATPTVQPRRLPFYPTVRYAILSIARCISKA